MYNKLILIILILFFIGDILSFIIGLGIYFLILSILTGLVIGRIYIKYYL